jgi:vesicle-fusing ATPase
VLTSTKPYVEFRNQFSPSGLFKKNLDLQTLGIGGLDREFQEMFRRAFVSRMQQEVARKMGIQHTKGILLYGPPGCGKTLLARELGKLLNCEEPKIVCGPELINSYQGKSEENVRNLFAEAMTDQSGSKLYLIICDEFDALCKQRGSDRGGTGVGDNIVNQFLTMIDGPTQLNNILLICMTNRKDLIDDAILRAGRIEVHIEIQLPDQKGREEILTIHTRQMATNKFLHQNVNIKDLANLTKNYTGAELAGLVKGASSFALMREVDLQDSKSMGKKANPIVSMEDFVRALNDIIPMFGRVSNDIQIINSTPFIFWDDQLRNISSEILSKISGLNKGSISTILITGETYIGKTKFVANVVKQSGVPCVKMITTEKLLKASNKSLYITDTFEQCTKADTSILVFDGLERLIEWMPIGLRFNNDVLHTIISVITSQINPSKKSILIFTANNQTVLENLGMFDLFDTNYVYPTMITSDEINVHFPDIGEKCKFQPIEEISNVFKYMKYV